MNLTGQSPTRPAQNEADLPNECEKERVDQTRAEQNISEKIGSNTRGDTRKTKPGQNLPGGHRREKTGAVQTKGTKPEQTSQNRPNQTEENSLDQSRPKQNDEPNECEQERVDWT